MVLADARAVGDVQVRAVNNLVTRNFTATLINDGERAVAVHGDDLALAILNHVDFDVFNRPVNSRLVLR